MPTKEVSENTSEPSGDGDRPEKLISAAGEAVKDALRDHKLRGNSVAAWENGKVVLIPPGQIKI